MCRQEDSLEESCGGSKIRQLLDELAAVSELCPYQSKRSSHAGALVTVPLNADNMALPKSAAQ
eukprot:1965215-Amphidinium_carterae.1